VRGKGQKERKNQGEKYHQTAQFHWHYSNEISEYVNNKKNDMRGDVKVGKMQCRCVGHP
jgi:hypothetical protein